MTRTLHTAALLCAADEDLASSSRRRPPCLPTTILDFPHPNTPRRIREQRAEGEAAREPKSLSSCRLRSASRGSLHALDKWIVRHSCRLRVRGNGLCGRRAVWASGPGTGAAGTRSEPQSQPGWRRASRDALRRTSMSRRRSQRGMLRFTICLSILTDVCKLQILICFSTVYYYSALLSPYKQNVQGRCGDEENSSNRESVTRKAALDRL